MALLHSPHNRFQAPVHRIAVLAFLLPVAGSVFGGSVKLAWDPVTSPAVAGYMLYRGTNAGNYTTSVDVGNSTTYEAMNLADGVTYHFAVTAYDALRNESGFSNDTGATAGAMQTPGVGTATIEAVVEYRNTLDFPGSPGGHFFYTNDPAEIALVDGGAFGRFARTGRTFNAGGAKQLCRFYGSVIPGPNSHFYTISDEECDWLKAMQKIPVPGDAAQWNYEGLSFSMVPAESGEPIASCAAGTIPVYRAYNNAYPIAGPRNPWDSAHRYAVDHADIEQMVVQFGWSDEGVAFCSRQ